MALTYDLTSLNFTSSLLNEVKKLMLLIQVLCLKNVILSSSLFAMPLSPMCKCVYIHTSNGPCQTLSWSRPASWNKFPSLSACAGLALRDNYLTNDNTYSSSILTLLGTQNSRDRRKEKQKANQTASFYCERGRQRVHTMYDWSAWRQELSKDVRHPPSLKILVQVSVKYNEYLLLATLCSDRTNS